MAIGQTTSGGGGGSCVRCRLRFLRLYGGRGLQVDDGPVVPLGGVELGLHCDLGY